MQAIKKPTVFTVGFHLFVVPKTRLELVQAVARHPLKMVCLPIPPLRHKDALCIRLIESNQPQKPYFAGCGAGVAGWVGTAGAVGAAGFAGATAPDMIDEPGL